MKKLLFFTISITLLIASCNKSSELGIYDAPAYVTNGDSTALEENPFIQVTDEPTSTFSIDADGGSYTYLRRFIQQAGQLPLKQSIRTEELLNYFDMDYPFGSTNHPIDLNGEVSDCPWKSGNKLIRIGIEGKPLTTVPNSNFVFLIDVSGSMNSDDKLGILKDGFNIMVDQLTANDRVSIVTYAGADKILLESASGDQKTKIKKAINKLGAGGGTNGAAGINTAYDLATANFIQDGNNRIIIGTDGDFNIGISDHDALLDLIEIKRESGIFLTTLGVGTGNYQESTMEQIANHGNGTYEYIDKPEQLEKIFIHDFSKFFTVAKDVKVQVQFNPATVESYRLIGYENRVLENVDFEDDTKDAGEIGADQGITALYEIVPNPNGNTLTDPVFSIDFRYKEPDSEVSVPINLDIFDVGTTFQQSSDYMQFSASIAGFSMLLTNSAYKESTTYDKVQTWLNNCNISDPHGYKAEFKTLVFTAKSL